MNSRLENVQDAVIELTENIEYIYEKLIELKTYIQVMQDMLATKTSSDPNYGYNPTNQYPVEEDPIFYSNT